MQNIVGTFDHASSARLAGERLRQAGLPPSRARFQPRPGDRFLAHAGPQEPRPGKPGYRHQGVLESLGGFFAHLLQSHTDESWIYAEALRRGTCLLLVQACDADEARHAVDVLTHSGTVSLEDRVGQWRVDGWTSSGVPDAPAAG